jgi:ATP-dependent Lon protease
MQAPAVDQLDQKALELFPGKLVRKDLVGPLKGEFNVPTYVLEYLLGRYCSSPDPAVVEDGLKEVRRVLTENYVRPDAPDLFKSQVRERGTYRVIDKVRVRLQETEDKYWAELVNLQVGKVHIGQEWLQKFERLLAGGIWAVVDLEYDPSLTDARNAIRPFVIRQVRPIQLAGVGLSEVRDKRGQMSTPEWKDLVLRSVGLEPSAFTERRKMLYLMRLLPFVERNYNLVELGPRNTGKSYVYRELSPYSVLVPSRPPCGLRISSRPSRRRCRIWRCSIASTLICQVGSCRRCTPSTSVGITASSSTTWPKSSGLYASCQLRTW